MVQRALLSVKNSHGRFAISMTKDKDDMPEKQRDIILFFQLLNYSPADSLLASEIFYFVKNTVQLSAEHHAMWPLCKLWEHRFSVSDLSLSPLVPALRSAQTKVSREYTPYIYTFTARSLSIENFSDSSNTSRGTMMLPLRKRSDLAPLARWQFNNVAYFVFFQFCWKSFCRQNRLDDGSVISRAS